MVSNFDNVHDLEKIEKYYFFADGILFSTQFTLLYSLFNFILQIENFFEGIEGDSENSYIELPEDDDDIYELFKNHVLGDNRLQKIYDKCIELSNKIKSDLNINEPNKISERILLRDKEVFITLDHLFKIYENFPLQLNTITSGVCDGMVSFPNQFKKTHKIVFKNEFEYRIYKNIISPVNSLDIEYDVVLNFLYIDDLEGDITEEIESSQGETLIYLSTNKKDLIKDYLDKFEPFLLALIPTNFGFINKKDFNSKRVLESNVW
ncbi:MAG: hypothetical protein ACOCRX_06420 [Candidatus Woesearchaeota archaeon]